MSNKLKSIALSAFVLPGLGQLFRGRRLKGGLMIMLDNLFILGGLFIALRCAGKLMVARTTQVTPEEVLAAIRTDAPYARWVLGAFLLLWVYGVADAALDKAD